MYVCLCGVLIDLLLLLLLLLFICSVIDGIAQQKALSVTLQHVRACNPVALSNDELITLARHFKQRVCYTTNNTRQVIIVIHITIGK